MEGRLAVNLRRDRWLLDDRSATVTGLEDVTLVAPSVRVLGDDGPSRMHGGSGADRLVDSHGPGTLHGGPGRDTLLGRGDGDQLDGGRGHDNLVGGPGRDRADGGSGRDRCRAERRTSCER
jgi:Ca2+-binding RTX toxin-like protein